MTLQYKIAKMYGQFDFLDYFLLRNHLHKRIILNNIGRTMNKEENKDVLEKNYLFFIDKLPELLKDSNKKNKIALIRNQKIIGFYENIEKAINTAKENKFELETFLIQKVEKQQIHYTSRTVTK